MKKLILILLTPLAFVSCGGTFQPPILTPEGYILSAIKSPDGTTYYVGANTTGDSVFQWTQQDGSKVRAVKPKKGSLKFYINDGTGWREVGAKEPIPVPPEGALSQV